MNDPWKLDDVNFDQQKGQLIIFISHKRGSKLSCPECGDKCSIHDTRERTWRHLNFFQYKTYIHCKVPRISCPKHGVKQVKVPWSRPGSGFTLLFEAFIMELAAVMPVNAISRLVGEYDTRIWRIMNYYVDRARSKENFSEAKNIGIDETSSKRGHNYVTLFFDLDKSKVVYATEGKDAATINSFIEDLKEHKGNPGQIKNVCCDMSPVVIKG
ncbi:MAG: transposase [Thermosediminibacterales bacterium]|nr:transposase [Thermosediminibacterales bacterium]MDK2835981.1 transposase [Thermosediminibacterales bacterium]